MPRPASYLIAAMIVLAACGETTNPPPPAPPGQLAVEPPSLSLSETKRSDKFFVSSSPSGSEVSWQVAQKPEWLTVTPDRGKASSPVEVTVTALGTDTLPAGTNGGAIRLISNGGGGGLNVTITISPNPRLTFSPATLSLGEAETSKPVYLKNSGNVFVEWSLTNAPPWLTVSPTAGFVHRGDSIRLDIRPDRGPLPGGSSSGSIQVRTGGENPAQQSLPVSVAVAATPILATSVTRLVFVPGSNNAPVTLYNRGKGPLSWSAQSPVPWLSFLPASGTLPVGDSVTVAVRVDRTQVSGNLTEVEARFSGNGEPANLGVQVVVSAAAPLAPGSLYGIAPVVVDAEYDGAGDRVIAVGSSPNVLLAIDATIPQQLAVGLPATPTAVSIRPDGRYAAIGHDGAVTLFDLLTMTVVRTVPTNADVLDVVLARNNWAYVFPRRDQWVPMRNVNLTTGADIPSSSHPPLYAGTVGRLHPDGRHMYLADNNVGPSDFLKYEIRDTIAELLYDSPYHGDFPFNGNLWFNNDGTQMFARSGHVFRASTSRTQDMTYVGRLEGVNHVAGAVHSGSRGRVYVLGQSDPFSTLPPELRVHSSSFFGFLGTGALPTVTTGAGTFQTAGRFVFLSADQRRLITLVEADQAAGPINRWFLTYFLTSSLP